MLTDTKQILKLFWNSDLRKIFKIIFFPVLGFLLGFGEIFVKVVANLLHILDFVLFKRNNDE